MKDTTDTLAPGPITDTAEPAPAGGPLPDAATLAAELRALRDAVEFAYLSAEGDISDSAGDIHDFAVSFDGDGWCEPFSVFARCHCQNWAFEWCQTDREQTGRPQVADLLVEWTAHVDTLLHAKEFPTEG